MAKEKVCFLVGSIAISGGTYVIVQHAAYLANMGYIVTLAIQEPFTDKTLAWHDLIPRLRCISIDAAKHERFDLVIATWWKTALELHHFNAPRYGYFVQSIESRFYPAEEAPLRTLVDATLQYPVSYVTEATWIQDFLARSYGHQATLVRNGIRKDIYRTSGPVIEQRNFKDQPRVLVEGPFGVPFKNTALGIRLAREAGAKNIWVLTGTPVKWLPRVARLFSQIPMNLTPNIYRSCDVLLKLSTVEGMFGPPLEMFHCGGTSVVFDVTGHDEYIIDGYNARVIQRDDVDGVVTALRQLLNERDKLEQLKYGASQTAKEWWSWDQSSAAFLGWIKETLAGPPANPSTLAEFANNALAKYIKDEQQRLSNVSRYKLSTLAAQLPPPLLRLFKQIEATKEVIFAPRKVR